ncbi:uncharacterized protein LOC116429076 [Nomia melanderi]|uniref:uncharacterized protein LOC116429076 n=1 Tax=Nomia melanderi TaxID=2448451 RepID=UPI003FCCF722
MVYVTEISQCKPRTPPRLIFHDNTLLYLQPAKRRPITYRSSKKPTIKIESDTTYGKSYVKFDCVPRQRFNYGYRNKVLSKITEKMDFDTVYKLSYQVSQGKVPEPFLPRSRLSIEGLQDMTTTHMTSYMDPGYAKVKLYKPYQGKCVHPVPMEYETITKESYQKFTKPITIKRPKKTIFWQTKSKTDYQTTNQLSYQYTGSISKRIHVMPTRPSITAQIEKDTTFKTSYMIPGRLVTKENV